ncbi:MAG TPA: phosphatase PAP2 family protein [Myxococcales bacterium]|nr:phosphatase PAP2 family protein [Myxococcales bacterium]
MRLLAVAICIGFAPPVRADGLSAGPTDKLALDLPKDGVILGLGFIASTVPLIFSSELAPKSCRWCDGPAGSPVNAVDNWFHDRLVGAVFSRSTSNTLSSVTAFGLMPAVALTATFLATGPYATPGAGARAIVIVGESVAVATALTQAIKFTAGRQRPYAHFQHFSMPGEGTAYDPTPDANLSFPSGHTSLAAALGTSAAMVATLEQSSAAPWLWGAAGALTVTTGALRMMSESHYFTDVLGGAVLGAGCGVLIPLLHRRGSVLSGSAAAAPFISAGGGRASFSLAGAF